MLPLLYLQDPIWQCLLTTIADPTIACEFHLQECDIMDDALSKFFVN